MNVALGITTNRARKLLGARASLLVTKGITTRSILTKEDATYKFCLGIEFKDRLFSVSSRKLPPRAIPLVAFGLGLGFSLGCFLFSFFVARAVLCGP